MAWQTVKLDVDRLGGVGWGGRPNRLSGADSGTLTWNLEEYSRGERGATWDNKSPSLLSRLHSVVPLQVPS